MDRRNNMRLRQLGVIALLIPSFCAFASGTFSVTTTVDSGPGSLRQAILDANTAGGGTINVSTGGQVSLASPLPMISAPLILNGNNLLINGNNLYRVFFVDTPGAVVFNSLSVING